MKGRRSYAWLFPLLIAMSLEGCGDDAGAGAVADDAGPVVSDAGSANDLRSDAGTAANVPADAGGLTSATDASQAVNSDAGRGRAATTCTETALLSNYSSDTACDLELGQTVRTKIVAPTKQQYFRLHVEPGVVYTVRGRAPGRVRETCGELQFYVRDPATPEELVLFFLDDAASIGDFKSKHSELELYARPSSSSVSCSYEVAVTPGSGRGLVQDAATFEPNDSENQAAPLELGRSVTAELSDFADPIDFYRFQAEAGKQYTLQVSGCGPYPWARAELVIGTGRQELVNIGQVGNDQRSAVLAPAASGTVMLSLKLSRTMPANACSYTVSVR